jgi:hypothetical protein
MWLKKIKIKRRKDREREIEGMAVVSWSVVDGYSSSSDFEKFGKYIYFFFQKWEKVEGIKMHVSCF